MIPAVERATRLRFRRHPVILRRTREQVREYVIHKFDDDLPPVELVGAQAAYRLFGLIPDSLDLRRTMVDLLTEQVAGYFDPDSNALYIPTDIDASQARLVISHELVHALQHQYLNLDSLVALKRQNDRRSAAQAILEGQATLAQILVLMPEQKIESLPNFWDLRTALGGQQDQMKVFGSAPLWLRESLIFPYLGGAELLAAGWDGDRYQVLGRGSAPGTAALVWYTLWDDKMAAARFRKGLESAWAKRGPGGRGVRRSQIEQLLVAGVPVVRLVDA